MKKAIRGIAVIAVLLVTLSFLVSCFSANGLFGGVNVRMLGDYCSVFSDGEQDYMKVSYAAQDRYVEIGKGGWELAQNTDESTLIEKEQAAELVMACGKYRGVYDHRKEIGKEEYEYLREQIEKEFADCENFDCVIFKKDNDFYGSVNCYTRASGPSGNLHTIENFDKSYIISVEDGKIKLKKELDDEAILASNQTHYISYTSKKFYSVNKKTNEKIMICEDEWISLLPFYQDYVDMYYSDEYFTICVSEGVQNNCTLFVGTMDGSYLEKVTDQSMR